MSHNKTRTNLFFLIFLSLCLLSGFFIKQNYASNILNYFGFNEKLIFEPIEDTQEIENHLNSLNLTPHHSVKLISTDGFGITKKSVLHGRFLHITDMHPDELNVIGAAIRKKCHKIIKNINDNSDVSHKFGDPLSGCDSPIDLYKETLKWIRENLKDHIDFVIWTGDNIRHDNDRSNPRTEMDIFDMNEKVANDFSKTFMDEDEDDMLPFDRRVKVIPSLGNNDVYPHNLFAPGPTLQTREMYKIWREFVPTEQMHTFDRGAYYLREVIPGKLVVLSINTLYWFQSNPLNDNCDNRKQPGYKLFLWLGATLKECRRRNLKVWLSGHVPPIPKNIHHSCFTKISVWMHEYRDIIIGGVWGHMNIDHWVPLDSVKAWRSIEKRLLSIGAINENEIPFIDYDQLNDMIDQDYYNGDGGEYNEDEDEDEDNDHETVEDLYRSFGIDIEDPASYHLHTFSDRYMGAPNGKVSYLKGIRDQMYSKLKGKKKGGLNSERYALAHISSSVIPTYNPGMRVWEYNITEFRSLDSDSNLQNENFNILKSESWNQFFDDLEVQLDNEKDLELLEIELETRLEKDIDDVTAKEEYVNLMSLTKDRTIPNIMPKDLELGPAYKPQTFTPENYVQYYLDLNQINYEANEGNWEFGYRLHYSTKNDTKLDSLLVKNWIKLGRKYGETAEPKNGNGKNKKIGAAEKMWEDYIDRAFLSSGYQNLAEAEN